jgi:hypothetical protein
MDLWKSNGIYGELSWVNIGELIHGDRMGYSKRGISGDRMTYPLGFEWENHAGNLWRTVKDEDFTTVSLISHPKKSQFGN